MSRRSELVFVLGSCLTGGVQCRPVVVAERGAGVGCH